MATSVRKAKRAKQSFEFIDSVPEKDMIQVQTPPQDGISETIHETMLDRVEHETHPFFVNKCRLIFHTPIKCNTFLTTFGKRKQISFNRLICSSAFEPFQNRLTFLKFTDEKRQGCSFQRGSI